MVGVVVSVPATPVKIYSAVRASRVAAVLERYE